MNEEQIDELARKVEVECLAVPGTSFHTVAQIAIEETIALLADGGNGECRTRMLERICEGVTDEMIEGGWTALGLSRHAKSLEDRLADGGKGEADKPTCPHCGLTDIEYSRTCHNSACSAYAREESFYRGWQDTAPQAECAPQASEAEQIAETIHWPEHWDTAAYPDVWSALQEVMHSFQCSECRLEPQAECAPRKYVETQPGSPNFDGAEAYEAHLNAECAPREAQPVVLVDRGALQAALNMLRRDAQEGRHARGELADEISASIAAPTPERADAEKDAARWKWLKMQSTVGEQWGIMKTPWGQWDAYADAAILAAKESGK
jgi:hypothetical protein